MKLSRWEALHLNIVPQLHQPSTAICDFLVRELTCKHALPFVQRLNKKRIQAHDEITHGLVARRKRKHVLEYIGELGCSDDSSPNDGMRLYNGPSGNRAARGDCAQRSHSCHSTAKYVAIPARVFASDLQL